MREIAAAPQTARGVRHPNHAHRAALCPAERIGSHARIRRETALRAEIIDSVAGVIVGCPHDRVEHSISAGAE
jgi:hypothetical protein